MERTIQILLVCLLAGAHGPFLGRFMLSLSRGTFPRPVLFASIGIILYYDLGYFLQVFNWDYTSQFFPNILTLSIEEKALLCIILCVSPYLLTLGALLASVRQRRESSKNVVELSVRLIPLIFIVFIPVCLLLGTVGLSAVMGVVTVVEQKHAWLGTLGRTYIVFLVPLFFLAFFVRTHLALSRSGALFAILLAVVSSASTLFLGQRTMTLLPFLILLLFLGRASTMRIVLGVLTLLFVASVTVYFYKGTAVERDASVAERVAAAVNNDLIRTNSLARAVMDSEMIGTKVLPNVGQGYLYSLCLYIPRSVLPEKGYSTAAYFTAFANGEDTEYLSWGLGIGFLEEIILNFGILAVIPGVILYGILLGFLDRLAATWPAAIAGCSLAPIWMSGYGSSSVILYFGSMILFSIVLEGIFASTREAKLTRHHGPRIPHGAIPREQEAIEFR